jgi:hypothetical protein
MLINSQYKAINAHKPYAEYCALILWISSVGKVEVCVNTMPLPVYMDRHHCCNIDVVSVGTRLNFFYIHDPFIPFFFLFH